MRIDLKKNSLYWKCQLAGWALFFGIALIFDISNNANIAYSQKHRVLFYSITYGGEFLLALLVSHLLRVIIKKTNAIYEPVPERIIYFLVYTLFSSLIYFTGLRALIYLRRFLIPARPIRRPDQMDWIVFALTLWTVFIVWYLIYYIYHYIQKSIDDKKQRAALKIQMVELEARALRSQMNPHFIFNCMNSIKSLIQQHEEEKSVTYLTTFSKLIRTLFNNADKKEISLYDEIETCKYYLQLEAMRFDAKFSYVVNMDEGIDLKSIQIPALIIQPFIENAIWHGIVPRNTGGQVSLSVVQKEGSVEVIIDDDGIGREASQQNKSATGLVHQSKGVNLTQSRLELNNLLQQRQAKLDVIDKKDANGMSTGTTVIITINEELS